MSTDTKRFQPRSSISIAVVVGLIVALFGSSLLGVLDVSDRLSTTTAGQLLVNSATMWLLVAAVLVVVLYWEHRSLASIGIELPSRREATVGVVAGVAGLVLGILATGIAVAALQLEPPETLSTLEGLSLPVKLAIVGTAVVTEEVLWRGYPIERLTELTGSLWVGAVASGVVFLAVHYPAWGLVGAIPQAVFTVAIVGVYVQTRNVVACVLAHTVINVAMILVLPAFI
jgi:membrane protease YdiL (CAAX protease family)